MAENETAPGQLDRANRTSAYWGVLAFLLLLFSNGRNTIAVAAWLAPVFLLRFVRTHSPRFGLLVAWLVLSGAFVFQFRGMVPLPYMWYLVLAAVYGLVETVPFALDRIAAHRIGGFRSTLVLPCSWVVTEYLVATFTPYGSWGAAAYSQHENLTLLQILSITGLYGVSFLIAWFAAIYNWIWEHQFEWQKIRRGVAWTAMVAVAVCFYGGARLALTRPDDPTVRVASLTKPDIELIPSPEVAERIFSGTQTADDTDEVRRRGRAINDDLLSRSEREAIAGARIVIWGESNGFALKDDEQELIQRGIELARDQQIYLGMGLATWNTESRSPLENKIVLITPNGELAWESYKAIPVPGTEAALSARDEGRIRVTESPYGRLSSAICFDMDFPGLLKQAGRLRTDVMLVPSNDWQEIDPWHSEMARFRSIEQGFNLVRHTSGGLSIATDYQGRVLSRMDHYTTAERVMISEVPTRGVTTVYSRIGDLFSWICIAVLLGLLRLGWRRPTVSTAGD
jgi:apolipoprotein N-acyltransferase